jgi:cytochrome c oxidase cbb3-type subunit 2
MHRIKPILKILGLLSFAVLFVSLAQVQSQEMDPSSMDMEEGEMKEIKGKEDMQNMGDMNTKNPNAMAVMKGKMIFQMSCFFCHGRKGEGDGPASRFIGPYSHPRPNNFTMGIFKFRSTESGDLPMLTDLMRTIREGIPGYMPSFRNLGEDSIKSVAMYIAKEFIQEDLPTTTTIKYVKHVGPYAYSAKSAFRGGQLFKIMKCNECHGDDGKAGRMDLRDERQLMIHPVDLTRQETFGNGTSHEDIYRTIMTGLDGTPMPGYNDSFKGEEDSAWDLVHYILSLQGR